MARSPWQPKHDVILTALGDHGDFTACSLGAKNAAIIRIGAPAMGERRNSPTGAALEARREKNS